MILDTNALSAVADGEPDARSVFYGSDLVAIPVIVLGEYWFGIMGSRRRQQYAEWLSNNLLPVAF